MPSNPAIFGAGASVWGLQPAKVEMPRFVGLVARWRPLAAMRSSSGRTVSRTSGCRRA